MPTQTEVRPNIVAAAQDLPDIESAVSHIESAIEQVYQCTSHTPDDFYAHKLMHDHATVVHRLTSMKRALEDRRNQLRTLSEPASAPSEKSVFNPCSISG